MSPVPAPGAPGLAVPVPAVPPVPAPGVPGLDLEVGVVELDFLPSRLFLRMALDLTI